MSEGNKKKLTIVLAVLAVICVFSVLVFSGIIDLSQIGKEEETTDEYEGFLTDSYTQDIVASDSSKPLPYLETSLDDIFYTMDSEGNVKFYQKSGNSFTQVEATGTYSASVVLSEMTVSADITYYQNEAGICGYGVHTAAEDEYTLYPYTLFCLRNYGSNYSGSSDSSCLLLIDTTQEDCYKNDKIFEESFTFSYSNSSASRSISEASRTVGINGAKRDDYFLLSDITVENSVANQLFFSGRHYAESDTTVDIFRTGGSGNNTDNIRVAQDVLGYWLYNDGTDMTYVTVDESGYVAVEKYNWDSGEVTTVRTFNGATRNDVLISGDYMYVNTDNIVYNLLNDTDTKLSYSKADDFVADMFVAQGEDIFLRGYVREEFPVGIIANGESGVVSDSYANEFFRNIVNPVILSDGSLMVTVDNGSTFAYYIF